MYSYSCYVTLMQFYLDRNKLQKSGVYDRGKYADNKCIQLIFALYDSHILLALYGR